ncbi:hypothetical protein Niako_4894 [Niastella koreensis GR20-10]|uniref:Uncharacterized protein n=1 Tax=Niastella koreensis (strain DSM 17620 / KACC 11465 / NBRC 106392 / GR20-10) TaxID=700598 RepID=G8TRK4_NIAKG|nr:hypothetical protein Niako_4894 [Niastella koreensis GR20-10]
MISKEIDEKLGINIYATRIGCRLQVAKRTKKIHLN